MSGEVVLRTGSLREVHINRREAARYLGYKMQQPAELDGLFAICEALLQTAAAPKACYVQTSVAAEKDTVRLDFCTIQSAALAKNLGGCQRAFVFAATLGAGVDRTLLRLEKTEPAKALVFDALASAAVEGWCDLVNAELRQGRRLRPRFSPGYGGVSLSHQQAFLTFLNAGRRLGITLSDTFFMTPVKSVTALIGIEEDNA